MFLLGAANNHLHPLIYMVADEPSDKNISESVPLVGTPSYKNLLQWIGVMDLDFTRIRLYNQSQRPFDNALAKVTLNKAIDLKQIKVIALGQKAAGYLRTSDVNEYFILPHPSPRNRQLNHKEFINMKLAACKNYVYQGEMNGIEQREESPQEDLLPEQKLQATDESGKLE
jgi:uracil-DNA glycosylase